MPEHPDSPPGLAALAAAAARDPRGGDAGIDLARAALREGRTEDGLRALARLVTGRRDAASIRGFLAGMRLLEYCIGDPRFDLASPVLGLRAAEDGTRLEVGLRHSRQVYDPQTWWSHIEDGPLEAPPEAPRRSRLTLVDLRSRPQEGSRRVVDVGDQRVVAEEQRIRVVDRERGRTLQASVGCRRVVRGLVGSPDGSCALTVDMDGEVVCWGTESGLPMWRQEAEALLPDERRRPRPAFSPDGRLLVWGPAGGAWVDPDTGAPTPLPDPFVGEPWRAAAPGPSGLGWACAVDDQVAVTSEAGAVRRVHTPAPDALAFLPGGEQLASVSARHLRVFALPSLDEAHHAELPSGHAWVRHFCRLQPDPTRGGCLLRGPREGPWLVRPGLPPQVGPLETPWARKVSHTDFAFTADGRHLLLPRGHHLRLVPTDE